MPDINPLLITYHVQHVQEWDCYLAHCRQYSWLCSLLTGEGKILMAIKSVLNSNREMDGSN